jgi:hypothetical protein
MSRNKYGDGDDAEDDGEGDDDWRFVVALAVGQRPGPCTPPPCPDGCGDRSGERWHPTCCDGEVETQDQAYALDTSG